ncbi:MAG: hypothetical protein IPL33_00170 [Sphingobacteriales bacterium]|nr:hypothetical protein [Sphingobacteriales bacterium]
MKHGFSLMLLWLILPASLFAQFQGNIDAINESVCQANGSVVVSGPASNLYALTGVSIPQIGPFSPPATFTDLPAGDYTITEFTLDNQEHSQAVTVPGNYEQNWIFTAEVDYDPCSNGTPSVSINNFTIINADPGEQRPPYLFRISSKNGSLPGDGSEPPAFTSATSFPIAFPSGMNGNYELQARDACGNYKTINVYVPLTAPSPSLTLAFNSFANCDGDGNYTATPSGGTPPYTFTITAGPDQVGSTITSNNTQSYVFTSGGTYTLQLTDNCGGITQQTVTAPLYQTPVAYGWGAIGSCTPPPGVGTGGINVYIENGIGPYNIVMDSDCGHPTYTGTGNMGNNIIGNLTRPCNYAITITDACGLTSTTNVPLVGPGDGVIYAYTNVRCPEGTSEEYILKIGLGYGPPL